MRGGIIYKNFIIPSASSPALMPVTVPQGYDANCSCAPAKSVAAIGFPKQRASASVMQ